jgi:amino acid permease
MTGVPIRWKLTLAFAAALAVVLACLGTFVYLRLAADLDRPSSATFGLARMLWSDSWKARRSP